MDTPTHDQFISPCQTPDSYCGFVAAPKQNFTKEIIAAVYIFPCACTQTRLSFSMSASQEERRNLMSFVSKCNIWKQDDKNKNSYTLAVQGTGFRQH